LLHVFQSNRCSFTNSAPGKKTRLTEHIKGVFQKLEVFLWSYYVVKFVEQSWWTRPKQALKKIHM
jgi:hypothetical protein